ncbi:MAG TPA: hypothetical protein DEB32_17105 [Stenotrophomonas sp.]|jgi:hypothetical protein|uniref:TetR transcriptional regulator CgmR-like C-terminal domain-containing protein n=1 Tax=Stenotrophomonas maltophilia TaxID=40324 RepID=A0A4S2D5E5_STEMA|nr:MULTISPECIES: hypothetical protein [Stenotrophomonas]TGY36415.1 hypothetical protein E5352_02655 [Stenotrophomonas maltophilia]HBS64387.1 hypothetical protein [Stenotrophomonas sp.]
MNPNSKITHAPHPGVPVPATEASAAAVLRFDDAVRQRMAIDPMAYGRFSRAYIATLLDASRSAATGAHTRCVDPDWISARRRWLHERLQQHPEEGRDPRLIAARYAADGVWLQSACTGRPAAGDTDRVLHALMAMTRPAH